MRAGENGERAAAGKESSLQPLQRNNHSQCNGRECTAWHWNNLRASRGQLQTRVVAPYATPCRAPSPPQPSPPNPSQAAGPTFACASLLAAASLAAAVSCLLADSRRSRSSPRPRAATAAARSASSCCCSAARSCSPRAAWARSSFAASSPRLSESESLGGGSGVGREGGAGGGFRRGEGERERVCVRVCVKTDEHQGGIWVGRVPWPKGAASCCCGCTRVPKQGKQSPKRGRPGRRAPVWRASSPP